MGLDTVELIMDIEDHFGIEIPNNEAAQLITVQDIINCVALHLNKPVDAQIINEVLAIVSDKTGIAVKKIRLQDRIVDDLRLD